MRNSIYKDGHQEINAATIYAEVMAAALVAPDCDEWVQAAQTFTYTDMKARAFFGTEDRYSSRDSMAEFAYESARAVAYSDYFGALDLPAKHVTFRTSARGTHRLLNQKARLLAFAKDVKGGAKQFGGGFVKTVKARPAVAWPAASITAFKNAIEDRDYAGALALAEDKLGAMFYQHTKQAFMLVAPVPCEDMAELHTAMNERGEWCVFETIGGHAINTAYSKKPRSRASAIATALEIWSEKTTEARDKAIAGSRAMPCDQAAARAQWLTEHGIKDDDAIAAQFEAQAPAMDDQAVSIDNWAREDVAQLVASAEAAVAIERASTGQVAEVAADSASEDSAAPADAAIVDDAREMVTVDCGDMAQDAAGTVCELGSASGASGGGSGGGFAGSVRYTIAAPLLAQGGAWQLPANFGLGAGGLYAGGNYAQAPAPADPAFNPEDIEPMRLTMPEVRAWSAAQFDAVYEHLEDINFHSECVVLMALRHGTRAMIKEARQIVRDHLKAGALGMDLYRARCELGTRIDAMRDAAQAVNKPAAPERQQARQASADSASAGVSVPVHKTPGEDVAALSSGQFKNKIEVVSHGLQALAVQNVTPASSGQFKTLTASDAADLQMHGKDWDGRDLTGWYWSEKMDGCRAYWDGANLYTKSGNLIDAPHITATLPAGFALDGEIYAGHGNYETARLFTQYGKNPEAVRFVAFDAPGVAGDWIARIRSAESTGVECVTAARIDSMERARFLLGLVLEDGGEGVMVRKPGIEYAPGRSCNMLKLKAPSMALFDAIAQQAAQAAEDDHDSGIYEAADAPADSAPAVAPDPQPVFEKFRPVAVDLCELVATGAAPDQLIGLGVNYSGDMANPSGTGAIVAAGGSGRNVLVDVSLEDGRHMRQVRGADFARDIGSRYKIDGKLHGAPYLAQLAAAVAMRKSSASAAKEQVQAAHAKALIDLVAQYPQLQRAKDRYSGGKLAAVNIRILLREQFKGIKFSVTSDYNSVRIHWADGPTDAQVKAIVDRFDIGAADYQTDYFYTVSTAWSDLFGGCQYMACGRECSDALILRALESRYPDASSRPSVDDWRKGTGKLDWCGGGGDRRWFKEHLDAIT